MSNAWRAAIGAAAVVIVVGLFFLLRDDDSDPAAETTTAATAPDDTSAAETETGDTTEETETEEATTEETTTEEGPTQFRVNVPASGPSRVQRLDAGQDERVQIVVTLGYHDDVHLHGYDLLLHTGPGLPPARFNFRATTPGRFEIETEGAHQLIAELRVRP
jgi:hypothetical protein